MKTWSIRRFLIALALVSTAVAQAESDPPLPPEAKGTLPISPASSVEVDNDIRSLYGLPKNETCHPENIGSLKKSFSKNQITWNRDLDETNYIAEVEPLHHCWKTHVYSFEMDTDEDDLSYLGAIDYEAFESDEEAQAGGSVTVVLKWVVRPSIQKGPSWSASLGTQTA